MSCRIFFSWFAALVLFPLYMGVGVLCVKMCAVEKMAIKGGSYTLTRGLVPGSTLVYHCPENYYPFPVAAHTCTKSGTWNPRQSTPAKCQVIECPQPMLENGSIMPYLDKYFVNNKTTYECYSSHTLRGSASRVCLPNGKWNGGTTICDSNAEDHCPDPGIPAGATRSGNSFEIDDEVSYSCDTRLYIIGSQTRKCQENRQWTGTEPQCYFPYTYDTPQEIAESFGTAIRDSLTALDDGTQEGKLISLDKNGLLNIYIAMDISESIEKEDFISAKKALKQLIQKISSFEVSPNYEILFFASEIKEIIDITEFSGPKKKSVDEIFRDLDSFHGIGESQGTDLSLAFKTIYERIALLEEQAKIRKDMKSFTDVKHVIVVFTDGAYNMGGDPKPEVDKIKEKVYMDDKENRDGYLDIYIFGVGTEIHPKDIKDFVTEKTNEKHYFTVSKGLDKLNETFSSIMDESKVVGLCGLYKVEAGDPIISRRRKYPWVAKIYFTGEDTSRNCLGSLVANKFVLTAAHCFRFEDKIQNIQVEIDDGTDKIRKVKEFILHPNYDVKAKSAQGVGEFYDYDIALIVLEKEVKFSTNMRPICIPCTKETNGALKLVGEGITCKKQEELLLKSPLEEVSFMSDDDHTFKEKIAYAQLFGKRRDCIQHALKAPGVTATDPEIAVTKNFLCTGGHENQRQDIACKGDSGGAVFKEYEYRRIQVGIVSWGSKDLCFGQSTSMQESDDESRDFHINLFRMVPFLKQHMGSDQFDYTPLHFLDD